MSRRRFTPDECARGGKRRAARSDFPDLQRANGRAAKQLVPPNACPRCGRSYVGKSWHAWLGHRGLHTLADRYFDGDIVAAQRRLRENGQARQDPAPWNGAFARYRPITNGRLAGDPEIPF
jgi:hypothetical protein